MPAHRATVAIALPMYPAPRTVTRIGPERTPRRARRAEASEAHENAGLRRLPLVRSREASFPPVLPGRARRQDASGDGAPRSSATCPTAASHDRAHDAGGSSPRLQVGRWARGAHLERGSVVSPGPSCGAAAPRRGRRTPGRVCNRGETAPPIAPAIIRPRAEIRSRRLDSPRSHRRLPCRGHRTTDQRQRYSQLLAGLRLHKKKFPPTPSDRALDVDALCKCSSARWRPWTTRARARGSTGRRWPRVRANAKAAQEAAVTLRTMALRSSARAPPTSCIRSASSEQEARPQDAARQDRRRGEGPRHAQGARDARSRQRRKLKGNR